MAESGFVVEVVYAHPEEQALVSVKVPEGALLRDAVLASGLLQRFSEIDLNQLDAGIFDKPAAADKPLRAGDRVQIYRPLTASPKEMRRQRAKRQR